MPSVKMDVAPESVKELAGSTVLKKQARLREAMRATLFAVAADVRAGLLETVGIESRAEIDERASVVIELPPETDTQVIARAVDMENVEAWCDEAGAVHVAIGPWYSTKDVDQVVLCVTKVVHVMLGLHASDNGPAKPKGVMKKLLASVSEVLVLQKQLAEKKNPPQN
jgi:hypothetical protein